MYDLMTDSDSEVMSEGGQGDVTDPGTVLRLGFQLLHLGDLLEEVRLLHAGL